MKPIQKCACATMLSAAGLGAVQHASYCPYAPTRAVCFAMPPEHVHGNHSPHSPLVPSNSVIVAISTSASSSITPPGATLVR